MGWLKRGPNKLEKLRALGLIEDAISRAGEPSAPEYEHVRTGQGRTAHLMSPPSAPDVLCGGWRGPWVPADPLLPVCRMCEDKAGAAGTARAAS